MALQIDVELNEDIKKKIEDAFAFLEQSQFKKVLGKVGSILKSSAQERISETKTDPDGKAWQDLDFFTSLNRARRGRDPDGILRDTSVLLGSIKFQVGSTEVEIGSDLIYAATHQFGDPSRNIPARPYLGVSTQDEQDIIDAMDAFLKKELG